MDESKHQIARDDAIGDGEEAVMERFIVSAPSGSFGVVEAADEQHALALVAPKLGNAPLTVERDEYVAVHDGNCNDYTGCNSACGWAWKSKAHVVNGLYRRV